VKERNGSDRTPAAGLTRPGPDTPSPGLEARDAVAPVKREVGDLLCIHPCRPKDRDHPVPLCEGDAGAVRFRDVEEERLAGDRRREAGVDLLGDLGRVGKERADLRAPAARPHLPVAADLPVLKDGQRRRAGLRQPVAEELRPLCREMACIVADESVEGNARGVQEARRTGAPAETLVPDVPVREEEPVGGVTVLHLEDPVDPEVVGPGKPVGALLDRETDAPAPIFGVEDIEPAEGKPARVDHDRERPDKAVPEEHRKERLRVDRVVTVAVGAAGVPALPFRPVDCNPDFGLRHRANRDLT